MAGAGKKTVHDNTEAPNLREMGMGSERLFVFESVYLEPLRSNSVLLLLSFSLLFVIHVRGSLRQAVLGYLG